MVVEFDGSLKSVIKAKFQCAYLANFNTHGVKSSTNLLLCNQFGVVNKISNVFIERFKSNLGVERSEGSKLNLVLMN
jgi:hypothetical protein